MIAVKDVSSESKGITLEFIQPRLFSQHKITRINIPKNPDDDVTILFNTPKRIEKDDTPTTLRCISDFVTTVQTLSSQQIFFPFNTV